LLSTSPAGLSVTADGNLIQNITTPVALNWSPANAPPGNHTLSVSGPQTIAGSSQRRYVFTNWTAVPDIVSPNQSQTQVNATPGSQYVANFKTQVLLTTSATANGTMNPSPSATYYDAASPVAITATPNPGYQVAFTQTGSSPGTTTSNGQSKTLSISALTEPTTVTATFTPLTGVAFGTLSLNVASSATNPTTGLLQVNSQNGFAGAVNLSWVSPNCWPAGLAAASFTQPAVTLTSGGTSPANVSLSALPNTPAGVYSLKLNATDSQNNLLGTGTVTVIVAGWSKEYIRLGGRVIAVENPPSAGPGCSQ